MQSYEKNQIDPRSIVEIWDSFSTYERRFFKDELKKAKISNMTFGRWLRDISIPQPSNRDAIIKIFRKMGKTTSSSSLFPKLNQSA